MMTPIPELRSLTASARASRSTDLGPCSLPTLPAGRFRGVNCTDGPCAAPALAMSHECEAAALPETTLIL